MYGLDHCQQVIKRTQTCHCSDITWFIICLIIWEARSCCIHIYGLKGIQLSIRGNGWDNNSLMPWGGQKRGIVGGEGVVALRIACRSDISLSASPGAFVETQLASQQAGHSFLLVVCWRQHTKYFYDVVDSRSCCSRDFTPTYKYKLSWSHNPQGG